VGVQWGLDRTINYTIEMYGPAGLYISFYGHLAGSDDSQYIKVR
jgi:hypothetical protein